MGLDMYAYALENDENRPEVDFELDPGAEQIHHWRKHPNLHGWMERLYHNKGGSSPDFNCNTVLLTPDDIDDFESAIKDKTLPETQGFFFGESTGEDYEIQDDLELIYAARQSIEVSKQVAYEAWC